MAVSTDYLTKWLEAEGIPDKTAATIAKAMIRLIFHYTNIRILITDQGCQFSNEVNEKICQLHDIDNHKTTAFSSQVKWANRKVRLYISFGV